MCIVQPTFPQQPVAPCPSCGHCPTCGHRAAPTPALPLPWGQPAWPATYGTGTTYTPRDDRHRTHTYN